MDALNQVGKPLKGSKVLVLGIAYKKNVDDMRESICWIDGILNDRGVS